MTLNSVDTARLSDLSDEDKTLILSLRHAAKNARSKIDRLEHELQLRERHSGEPRSPVAPHLEKSVETGFVDIYSSEEVNQELRSRLPRAQKRVKVVDEKSQIVGMNRSYSPVSNASSEPILDPDEISRIINGEASLPRRARSNNQNKELYEPLFPESNSPDPDPDMLTFPDNTLDSYRSGDGSRQMGMLLSELDAARQDNRKLTERLDDAERLLERMRLDADSRDVELEAMAASQGAELVGKITESQRERDAAMMDRIRLANQERDAALTRAAELQKMLHERDVRGQPNEEYPILHNDHNMEGVLRRLEDADGQIRETAASPEVQALIREREAVNMRNQQLQQEITTLHRHRLDEAQSSSPSSLKEQLQVVSHERDMAQARIRRLEDEMQTLRVYYSLHKSLTSDPNSNLLHPQDVHQESRNVKENNRLLAQMKSILREKTELAEQLHKEQVARAEADSNVQKLERLVNVLRRKLNSS